MNLSRCEIFAGAALEFAENAELNVDLSILFPEEKKATISESVTTTATLVLLLSTAAQALGNGGLAEIWGAINGMQLAAYQPVVNIPIAENAAEFSSAVVGIVTFDIPDVDMEILGPVVECPEDDGVFTDLVEETINYNTTINGT